MKPGVIARGAIKPTAVAAWFQRCTCRFDFQQQSRTIKINRPPCRFWLLSFQKQGKANKCPPANTAEAVNT